MEVGIQNSLNLNSVEQSAKQLLGMQKLSNKQTVYVSLPKKDYIETEAKSVDLDSNKNIFEKIIDKIKDILKESTVKYSLLNCINIDIKNIF